MDLFSVWKIFFEKYDEISAAVSITAKRSGLSEREALALILVNEFPEKAELLDIKDTEKLFLQGLAQISNNRITVTGKGAILAKSFINTLAKKR